MQYQERMNENEGEFMENEENVEEKEEVDELHNGEMMEVEGEGEKYYQGENGEENNIEGEEGEEDIYKQQEERDTMQKL